MPPKKKAKERSKIGARSLVDKASLSINGYALDDNGQYDDEPDVSSTAMTGSDNRASRKRKHGKERYKKSMDLQDNNSFHIKTPNHRVTGVHRTFRNITNDNNDIHASTTNAAAVSAHDNFKGQMNAIATPSYIRCNLWNSNKQAGSVQKTPAAGPSNPYRDRYQPPSSAKGHSYNTNHRRSTHVVASISENLARETCLTTMDAGSPVSIQVHKMGNGLMYSETISFLEILQPDEILLNEGRKNSQLCQKVLQIFGNADGAIHDDGDHQEEGPSRDLTGACCTNTVVKFVPRSYFDQNRGAELLRHVAREGAYDATVLEEYILLSSSYALLQYMQICLGADFARNSIDLCMNWGGSYKMALDRGTISHLELLANAKTGKSKHSLIGTIDCTKTSVGARLLRMNLMAPPAREDTILARLDLVDTFLEDEQFFYEVMDQLCALPDLEKMLAPIALIPKMRVSGGNKRQVTARMASKGISSLVCIKSALSVIPNFARVLEIQLKCLIKKDNGRLKRNSANEMSQSESKEDEESRGSQDNQSDSNDSLDDDSSNDGQSCVNEEITDDSSQTMASSNLLLGLGSGPLTPKKISCSSSAQRGYQLLRAIISAMKNPHLQDILDAVVDIFTESTTYSKNSHAMRHQECFALKPNTDGMMDVLRKAFLANVDDIYKLANEYAEEFGFVISVKETTARGYYLSIPVHSIHSDLPPTFIQPVKSGKFINCTTEEVLSLSARAQENVQDLLLMTHDRIQEVMDIARHKHDALASLCDAVALIDMCHCFADNVAQSRSPWCRPTVTDSVSSEDNSKGTGTDHPIGSGSIAIRNGRYAIDVSNTGLMTSDHSFNTFIPNDTYASAFQNFTVITGINGSGKSTYLKQLAIIVILAHCGSYVPAEEAFIPIRDRICTRIGTNDDQEHNISTFMQEMKDTAFICRNATDKSLILIDELGRATSNEDGVAIAWAVAEFLLVKRAMTFFVTHYPQLCRLADVYPNVQNQHLGAMAEENSGEIRYLHKILPGSCKMSADYGIEIAATCGWQLDVVEMARAIRREIEKKLPDDVLCQNQSDESNVDMLAIRHKAETTLNDLAKHLVALKSTEGRLNHEARKSYLQDLHDQFASPNDPNVIQMMKNLLLDNEEVTTSSLPLRPEGLTCIIDLSEDNYENKEEQQNDPEVVQVGSITNHGKEHHNKDATNVTIFTIDSSDSEENHQPLDSPCKSNDIHNNGESISQPSNQKPLTLDSCKGPSLEAIDVQVMNLPNIVGPNHHPFGTDAAMVSSIPTRNRTENQEPIDKSDDISSDISSSSFDSYSSSFDDDTSSISSSSNNLSSSSSSGLSSSSTDS